MPSTAQKRPDVDIRPEPGAADRRRAGQRREGARASRMLLAGVLVLLAAVGAGLLYAYHYWQDARQVFVRVHDRLAAARAAQDEMLRGIDDTRHLLEAQRGELDRQEAVLRRQSAVIAIHESEIRPQSQSLDRERRLLRETREALVERLEEVSRRGGDDADRWLIPETESLLRAAGNRLAVMRATDSVLFALRRADMLLARAGDEWQPARVVLRDEIAAVEAYRPADVRALAEQLQALDRRSRRLEFKETILPLPPGAGAPRPPPADTVETSPEPSESLVQSALAPVRGRGTVHAAGQGLPPARVTRHGAAVRQQFRLAIDSARTGALNRDPDLYRAGLNAASDLLTDFFAESPARDGIVSKLQRLAESPVMVTPPRIGRTLSLLESLTRRHAMP